MDGNTILHEELIPSIQTVHPNDRENSSFLTDCCGMNIHYFASQTQLLGGLGFACLLLGETERPFPDFDLILSLLEEKPHGFNEKED